MSWLRRFLDSRTQEKRLDQELRFHLDQHADDLVRSGLDPREARRRAWLALGGEEQVKERCRDARGARWLEDLVQDLRYALRGLRQNAGFAAVTLSTLALGIGATTLMFTLVYSVLLKPLPYANPNRLLLVLGQSDDWTVSLYGEQKVAYLDFLDCQRLSRSMDLAGWVFDSGTMSGPGNAERLARFEASSNLFSTLGVSLFQGREFSPEEDRAGEMPVAILGYSLWQRHFGGNPAVLGTTVILDRTPHTIVGIAGPTFRLQGQEADVYTPAGQNGAGFMRNRRAHPVGVIARLRPGASPADARAELAVIGRQLAEQYSDSNKGRSFRAEPLRPFVGDAGSTLWLLLGAVCLVLLIACVNVASLLLARAVSRERELAMRMALGAGRGRLIRQCLTESAVLGLGGGLFGVLLAAAGLRPFLALWPGELPRVQEVQLDWHVLLFAERFSFQWCALRPGAGASRAGKRP